MSAFEVQLVDQRVRVVLHTRTSKMIYARFWLNGVQYDKKTGQRAEREARKHATLIVFAAAEQKAKNDDCLTAVLAKFYAKKWPDGGDYCSSTKSQLNAFAEFAPEYHNKTISEATKAVQEYIDTKLKAKASPATIKNHAEAVRRFSKWMMRRKLVPWIVNPAGNDWIELPPCPQTIETPLTQDEIERFTAFAKPLAIWPSIVLVMSGCRPKSVLDRLEWSDINFDIPNVKTFEKRVERFVPLSEWAVKELEPRKSTGKIWHLGYYTGFDILRSTATKAGTKNIGFQALRRSLVWLLWRAGVPVQDAAKLCGHTLATAAKYYAQANDLDAKAAASKISLSAFGSETVAKTVAKEA